MAWWSLAIARIVGRAHDNCSAGLERQCTHCGRLTARDCGAKVGARLHANPSRTIRDQLETGVNKFGATASPVVPGRYFVFVERLVQEQYQTLVVEADSEEQARAHALEQFFSGTVAHMGSAQIEPPTARVRPVREKHLRKLAERDDGSAPGQALRTSERFEGLDGERVDPSGAFPGTRPAAITRGQARLMCQNFDASGHSNHSGKGSTLWVILEHCAEVDIAYNLRAIPGLGYYVERTKSIDDGLVLRMSVETGYGPLHD